MWFVHFENSFVAYPFDQLDSSNYVSDFSLLYFALTNQFEAGLNRSSSSHSGLVRNDCLVRNNIVGIGRPSQEEKLRGDFNDSSSLWQLMFFFKTTLEKMNH